MSDIERAEYKTKARAMIMVLAAVVLLITAYLQYGDAQYSGGTARGGSWALLVLVWLIILANGGGIRLRGRMRALLNDELALQNRSQALTAGFYAAITTSLIVYVANWSVAIATGDAIKVVTAAALSTALLYFAWLEWR